MSPAPFPVVAESDGSFKPGTNNTYTLTLTVLNTCRLG